MSFHSLPVTALDTQPVKVPARAVYKERCRQRPHKPAHQQKPQLTRAGLLTTQQRLRGERAGARVPGHCLSAEAKRTHQAEGRGEGPCRERSSLGEGPRDTAAPALQVSRQRQEPGLGTHGARPGSIRESLSPRAPLAQRQVNAGQEATRRSTLAAPGQLIAVRAMPSGSSDWTCGAQRPAEAGRQEPRGRRSERRDGYGVSTAAPASQGRGQGDRSTLLRFKTVSSEGRKKRPAPAYLFQERRRDQASQTMGIQSWCRQEALAPPLEVAFDQG